MSEWDSMGSYAESECKAGYADGRSGNAPHEQGTAAYHRGYKKGKADREAAGEGDIP